MRCGCLVLVLHVVSVPCLQGRCTAKIVKGTEPHLSVRFKHRPSYEAIKHSVQNS